MKALMAALAMPKKAPDSPEPDGAEGGDADEACRACAQEMMDAVKADDVDGFAQALKSFMEMY